MAFKRSGVRSPLAPQFKFSVNFKKEENMTEVLVVVSKVKEYLKEKGVQTSETAIDALSGEVKQLLDKAAKRAQSNNRQTVKDRDI